jgi:hypothetical protein
MMRPDRLEITTSAGTIAIKTGSTQNAVLMLSAAGENGSPWVGTGITVAKDDEVKILASGRVHTAMAKLINIAQKDQISKPSWVGPKGSTPGEEKEWDSKRNKSKLMPDVGEAHYGYGMLLAAVRTPDKKVQDLEPVGTKPEFTVKIDGELVLAVNDIRLNPDARDIYALPFDKDNLDYYKFKAREEGTLKEEKVDFWPETTLYEKAKEQYQKRLEAWKEIFKESYWMIWYEDNIGAYSVSVTVCKHDTPLQKCFSNKT